MKELFALRGEVSTKTKTLLNFLGFALIILFWQAGVTIFKVSPAVLPSPLAILKSFRELWYDDKMFLEIYASVKLNMLGYIEAIAICLPLAYIIALIPLLNHLSSKMLDSIRYLPLSALLGLFIAWFGIGTDMKIHFLAFSIFVYLLPTCVDRVLKVDKVYEQTAYTLGASKWQLLKSVFFPASIRFISDDIRILNAISWTYIIIAEMVNKTNGIGSAMFLTSRLSRIDKIFAWLIIIIIIGYLQDVIFKLIDKLLFPSKYK